MSINCIPSVSIVIETLPLKYKMILFTGIYSLFALIHYALQTNLIHKYLMLPVYHNYKLKNNIADSGSVCAF